jgi:hypothetical protein
MIASVLNKCASMTVRLRLCPQSRTLRDRTCGSLLRQGAGTRALPDINPQPSVESHPPAPTWYRRAKPSTPIVSRWLLSISAATLCAQIRDSAPGSVSYEGWVCFDSGIPGFCCLFKKTTPPWHVRIPSRFCGTGPPSPQTHSSLRRAPKKQIVALLAQCRFVSARGFSGIQQRAGNFQIPS